VNDPPRVRATNFEEARQIQANANHAQRRAEEQRQVVPPCARDLHLEFEEAGLPTFNSPQASLGAALACLQQANPSPELEAAMACVRVATALVEEKSAVSKSVASTSSRHLPNRSNRPAHSKLPTIQEEVNQPRVNTAPGVDLRANLDKNRRGRDARGYIDQRRGTRAPTSPRLRPRVRSSGRRPPDHGVRGARTPRRREPVACQYEAAYGHPEGPSKLFPIHLFYPFLWTSALHLTLYVCLMKSYKHCERIFLPPPTEIFNDLLHLAGVEKPNA
jgi:hypothetical protein